MWRNENPCYSSSAHQQQRQEYVPVLVIHLLQQDDPSRVYHISRHALCIDLSELDPRTHPDEISWVCTPMSFRTFATLSQVPMHFRSFEMHVSIQPLNDQDVHVEASNVVLDAMLPYEESQRHLLSHTPQLPRKVLSQDNTWARHDRCSQRHDACPFRSP